MTRNFNQFMTPARRRRILEVVPASLRDLGSRYLQENDWSAVLGLVSSELRVDLLRALWPYLPISQRPNVLGQAVCSGDALLWHWAFLNRALNEVRRSGLRGFDSEAARDVFNHLPERLSIFRGACAREVELGRIGVSWTLDREKADWFATVYRYRNQGSEPVVLKAEVRREAVCSLWLERNESEVLINSRRLEFEVLSPNAATQEAA